VYLFNPANGPVNEILSTLGIEGPLWFNSPGTAKPTLVLGPSSLSAAAVGSSYSQALSAGGGTAPYKFGITGSGVLSGGLWTGGGLPAGARAR